MAINTIFFISYSLSILFSILGYGIFFTNKIFNNNNEEIGKITSGTFGPSVDHSIAMGYVKNNYSSLDTKIFLEVRGKKVPANICNLPFCGTSSFEYSRP